MAASDKPETFLPTAGAMAEPAPVVSVVDSYLETIGSDINVAQEPTLEGRRRVRAFARSAETADSAWLGVMEALLAQRPLLTALWPHKSPLDLLHSPPSDAQFAERCDETVRALDAIARGDVARREQAQAAHGMLQQSLERLRSVGSSPCAAALKEHRRVHDEVLRILSAGRPSAVAAPVEHSTTASASSPIRSVAELLRVLLKAPTGAVLELSAGGFVLTQGLEIRRAVTLKGAGRELTRIVCEAEGFVVRLACEAVFTAQDIGFEHRGGRMARVAMIDKGEGVFERCSFTGGVVDRDNHRGGTGIEFQGGARGRVIDCVCEGNTGSGIRVLGRSAPTLEGNVIRANLGDGIFYFDSASGLATGNTSEGNREGISVGGKATPTLEGNVLRANHGAGIAYFETAGGVARGNTCVENSIHGISVEGQATPTLDGNTLGGNVGAGIAYFEAAGGAARANTCEGNRQGISAAGQSAPTLDRNVLCANQGSGIAYFESAGGTARANICEKNESHGVAVQGEAAPMLDGNTLRSNMGHGIAYFETAGGTARANTSEGNRLNGFGVGGQAAPTLEGNTLRANEGVAVAYFEGAGGVARRNDIVGEGPNAVLYVKRTACPTLQGNTGRVVRQKG